MWQFENKEILPPHFYDAEKISSTNGPNKKTSAEKQRFFIINSVLIIPHIELPIPNVFFKFI